MLANLLQNFKFVHHKTVIIIFCRILQASMALLAAIGSEFINFKIAKEVSPRGFVNKF
jgi:hypothetical protein